MPGRRARWRFRTRFSAPPVRLRFSNGWCSNLKNARTPERLFHARFFVDHARSRLSSTDGRPAGQACDLSRPAADRLAFVDDVKRAICSGLRAMALGNAGIAAPSCWRQMISPLQILARRA